MHSLLFCCSKLDNASKLAGLQDFSFIQSFIGRTTLKKMIFFLFFFLCPFCYATEINCEQHTSYLNQICYIRDYQSPECGPYLLNCPITGVQYDIACISYICKV